VIVLVLGFCFGGLEEGVVVVVKGSRSRLRRRWGIISGRRRRKR